MDYSSLKVTELKDELKKRGIASTGLTRKQQIVDRLLEDDAEKGQTQTATQRVEDDGEQVAAPESLAPEPLEQDVEPAKVDAAGAPEQEVPVEERHEEPDTRPAPILSEEKPLSDLSQDVKPTPVTEAAQDLMDTVGPATPPLQPLEPEQDSESKKRKRRSASPPISQDSVNKKLKEAEEDVVKFEREGDKVAPKPEDSMDKSMEVTPVGEAMAAENPATPLALDTSQAMDVDNEPEITSSPALHPATTALYIRNLVRPLNIPALKAHLASLAKPSAPNDIDTTIQDLYLDALKTHAFVLFDSVSSATRARSGLHDTIWPNEPTRKPLWVDFIPEERLQEWISTEKSSSGPRASQAKRFEVEYSHTDSGSVAVELVEVGGASKRSRDPPLQQQPEPRSRPSIAESTDSQIHPDRRTNIPSPPLPAPNQAILNTQMKSLDALFPSTTQEPKIYFLPVEPELVTDRLRALRTATSRDWDARDDARKFGGRYELGRGLDQLRRYTFEDGDRLVDGGAEFGGGRGGGGGRGRGRGSGYYGGGSRYVGGGRSRW